MPITRTFATITLLFAATIFAACGGDDSKTAKELIPDLEDVGLEIVEEGRDPLAMPEQDVYRARYADPEDENREVVAIVYREEDEATAMTMYRILSEALENPPPDFFGGDGEQVDFEPIALGDERRAYATASGDRRRNRIWTDIYRSDRVVVITQVLGQADVNQVPIRTLVAERIIDSAD